jgi:RNA polymerase sigma factor (sigma-70 family)
MNDDATLLRRYADEGSEPAFTELVHRHLNLVYGAALRRTSGDAHRAADVAQQVFITLAREARRLSRHTVLGAWLHTATRNAALNLMISEKRRQDRELAAEALVPAAPEPPLDWDRLRPVLDSAIDELSEADRAAVVLRFLEQRPFAEIGATLRVSEDAARMRTERALDKLRGALSRRGITSTCAAVGTLVSSQPLLSAPAGLAASITARALLPLATGAAAVTAASFLTMKLLTTATLTAIAAFGAGAYFGFSRDFDAPPPPPLATPEHSQLIASLRRDNKTLRAEVDQLNAKLATAQRAAAATATAVKAPTPVLAQNPVSGTKPPEPSRKKPSSTIFASSPPPSTSTNSKISGRPLRSMRSSARKTMSGV